MISEFQEHISGLYTAKCDLDLTVLRKSAAELEEIINTFFDSNGRVYSGKSTATTKLYSQYNFCLYPLPGIHELYWDIAAMFHTSLTDYHKGRINERFFMQSWLNVYHKGEYIDWHSHTKGDFGGWHGFFCLDVEPNSHTLYKWEDDPNRKDLEIKIESKNNLIVMGLSNGDKHRSSVWNRKKPRVTIAFDILPASVLYESSKSTHGSYLNAMKSETDFVNHWIPI